MASPGTGIRFASSVRRRRLTHAWVVPLVLLVAGSTLTGCGSADSNGAPAAVVRDSAGVTIVENPSIGDLPRLGWTVGPGTLLDVGTLDGPPEYQLFRVRDALRLPDGRVAVINGGSSELRLYGADGTHLGSWGGEGDGPGEFRSAWSIARWPGDTLGVWDNRARRITLYDADGSLGRSFPLPPLEEMEFPRLSLVTPDGNLVLEGSLFGELPETSGYVRVPVVLRVIGPDGTPRGDLGRHLGDETFIQISEERVEIMQLPFTRRTVVASAGNEILIAPNERLELRFHTLDGALSRVSRFAEAPRLVTDADRSAELERRLEGAPEQARPGIRVMMETVSMPDTFPTFTNVLTDEVGAQWVQLFRSPADSGPDRWMVMDSDGVGLGTIALPEGFEVYEIGDDYVLGLSRDELDVEHLQVLPLLREVG